MSSFSKEPALKQLPSGEWEVVQGFTYDVLFKGSGTKVKIPKGFKTDFASIPRVLRWLFSPTDPRWTKISIVHDFLYRKGKIKKHRPSRFLSDNIFFGGMRCNKKNPTPLLIAILFWLGVRGGGIFAYQK